MWHDDMSLTSDMSVIRVLNLRVLNLNHENVSTSHTLYYKLFFLWLENFISSLRLSCNPVVMKNVIFYIWIITQS